MTLCRVIGRISIDNLLKPATTGFCLSRPEYRMSNRKDCVKTSIAKLSSSTHYGGYNKKARWGWKMYLATVAGLGGATTLLKSCMEEAYCSEKEKTEMQGIWKDWKITLYQYTTCPFCTKTRTFLHYYQIPSNIVEVHPIFKKEIKFSEKYKKVPIVTIETKEGTHELQDSSLIISILSTYQSNEGKRSIDDIMKDYPASEIVTEDGKNKEIVMNKYWVFLEEPDKAAFVENDDPRENEVKWRQWTDEHLVHLISPNVYRTLRESYQAFDHHVKLGRFNGTWEGVVAKYGGALAMWMISKRLKKKWCKEDDVRMDLYRACNEWCDALGKKKFMGGNEPNLADLSVYAVLNVMEGLVSFEDVTTYTRIKPWYYRVQKAVEANRESSPH